MLNGMTALELGQKIKERQIGVAEAVREAYAAIDAREAETHCYISLCRDRALRQAESVQQRIDAGDLRSPLAGVPMAVKDNICTQGVPTTCASKILTGFVPPYNATVFRKLEDAGAVLLGKLNMDEFAMGSTTETSFAGATRNPWDTTRVPGGSSGGPAAAVAAGEAMFALGSDTGGSIRQPAAFCGVTGLKPTYGTVSRYGLVAYASSLDQIGPLGRDVADVAAVYEAISGYDPQDSTSMDRPAFREKPTADLRGKRIGIPAEYFGEGLNPEVKEAVLQAAWLLEEQGAALGECRMPELSYAIPTYYIIACAEAGSNLSRYDGVKYGFAAEHSDLQSLYLNSRTQGFGPEAKRRMLLGAFVLSSGYYEAYYLKALRAKALIKGAFDRAFEEFDLLLCPTAPTTAPRLGESLSDPLAMYLGDIYTVSVNLAGLPGLVVPCGFDHSGLPIGMQLIGKPFGEKALLDVGLAYQELTDHHKKTPEGRALA